MPSVLSSFGRELRVNAWNGLHSLHFHCRSFHRVGVRERRIWMQIKQWKALLFGLCFSCRINDWDLFVVFIMKGGSGRTSFGWSVRIGRSGGWIVWAVVFDFGRRVCVYCTYERWVWIFCVFEWRVWIFWMIGWRAWVFRTLDHRVGFIRLLGGHNRSVLSLRNLFHVRTIRRFHRELVFSYRLRQLLNRLNNATSKRSNRIPR